MHPILLEIWRSKMRRFGCFFILSMLAIPLVAGAEDPVNFPDANLQAAVEQALGVVSPTPTEMLGLTDLFTFSSGIVDLTGLETATNLTTLAASSNQISDLSPLSGLTNLNELSLVHNPLNTEAYCNFLPLILSNNPEISFDFDPNPNPLSADCSFNLPELIAFANQWLSANCILSTLALHKITSWQGLGWH